MSENLLGVKMIKDYIVEIGLDAVKDRITNEAERNILQEKLENFIIRQKKYNYQCTLQEELDFAGLAEYIRTDLIEDIQLRLFGNNKERGHARNNIINKATYYAQAHTSLSRKRAIDLTETACKILQEFYKRKANRDLKLIASQIEDTLTEQITTQAESISELVTSSKNETVQRISSMIEKELPFSLATNIQLMRDGAIKQVENNIANWFDAVGCTHKLFPDYCYDIKSGTHKLYSRPLTKEAIQKYPPKISCTGTIQINGNYIEKLDINTIDYANRHQLPITLNIKTAEKYLGTELDPVQHEADNLIGKTLVVPPKPFPPAFPCNISLDDQVFFDYVLFRTEEILDDDSIVISNVEQANCPFKIKMTANLKTKETTFFVSTIDANNKDLLKYARFLKHASLGAIISIKALSLNEEFAKGKLSNLDFKSSFDSLDDEIDFLEKVVSIEKYFGKDICVPNEIYTHDFHALSYLHALIQRESCTGSWTKFEVSVPVTESLKNKITAAEDSTFTLSYVGNITVSLYGNTYELSAIKKFDVVRYHDLEHLKKKVEVLDVGDDIKLVFLPGNGTSGTWYDELHDSETPLSDLE